MQGQQQLYPQPQLQEAVKGDEEFKDELTVLAKNLPIETTLEIFYHYLQHKYSIDIQKISKIKIKPTLTKLKIAQIEFQTPAYAQQVKKDLNGQPFLKRLIEATMKVDKDTLKKSKPFYFKIKPAGEKTIADLDIKALENYFSQFGEIVSFKIVSKQEKRLDYGYVSFKDGTLKDVPDMEITKLVENAELKFNTQGMAITLSIFLKERPDEQKSLRMVNFTEEIQEDEINQMAKNTQLKEQKEAEFKDLIKKLLPENLQAKLEVAAKINLDMKKPQIFINNFESDEQMSEIKKKLFNTFIEFKPEITKYGKQISILLQNVKKDSDIKAMIKIIEDSYGQVKSYKNKEGEFYQASKNIPNSKNPKLDPTSCYVIFTFVDQEKNEEFILGYTHEEKLKDFFNLPMLATYKLSGKQMGEINKLKSRARFNQQQVKSENILNPQYSKPQGQSGIPGSQQLYQQGMSGYQQLMPQQMQYMQQMYSMQQQNQIPYNYSQPSYYQTQGQHQYPPNRAVSHPGPQSNYQNKYNKQNYPRPYNQQNRYPKSNYNQQQQMNQQVSQPSQIQANIQNTQIPQQTQPQPQQPQYGSYQQIKENLESFMKLDKQLKQQILGQLLYPKILKSCDAQTAPKITGMLIDFSVFEEQDIFEFFESEEELAERVNEAKELIQQQTQAMSQQVVN